MVLNFQTLHIGFVETLNKIQLRKIFLAISHSCLFLPNVSWFRVFFCKNLLQIALYFQILPVLGQCLKLSNSRYYWYGFHFLFLSHRGVTWPSMNNKLVLGHLLGDKSQLGMLKKSTLSNKELWSHRSAP